MMLLAVRGDPNGLKPLSFAFHIPSTIRDLFHFSALPLENEKTTIGSLMTNLE